MVDAAEYLARAEEAEGQAATAPSAIVRDAFLRLAEGWRELARQAAFAAAKEAPPDAGR